MHFLESFKFDGGPPFVRFIIRQELDLFLPDGLEMRSGDEIATFRAS